MLAGDPVTQLAFSIYENKSVYALLVGSGLSRAAEIPTGWEITLDLVRRVAAVQGVEGEADWAAWYRDKIGEEANYSTLVGELGLSRDERRAILHSYIEPTAEDREAGRKLPTKAHHAIAGLVRDGYIKVIVTTNFDRLLENALREAGVEPTIVASLDALKGAEPLVHTTCYILKLHGDYKDARILNTDEELTAYQPEYDALLDRIIDEHGLIVCGWSGEWDHALRAAILRAPSRRYPTFWAARGKLGDGATEIVKHRAAKVIEIADADSFFSGVQQRVETLARTHRQNPLNIDLLVSTTKRYLTKPEYAIQLDDLVTVETQALIEKLEAENLMGTGNVTAEEFGSRVRIYEGLTEPLARMAGVLGRWGSGSDKAVILDVVRMLCAQADRVGDGYVELLALRTYPAVLVMAAYGLGLTRSERWDELHGLFGAQIKRKNKDDTGRAVERLFLTEWSGGEKSYWNRLEELKDRKTPLSDHLWSVFNVWSTSFVGSLPDFETLFESWEILGGLADLEKVAAADLDAALAERGRDSYVWFPIGRGSWNEGVRERVLEGLLSEGVRPSLLKAGFGKGDEAFLRKSVENYRRLAGRFRW